MAAPERPFVPHRTPKNVRPVASSSEFRVGRPFVAGAESASAEPVQAQPVTPVQPAATPAWRSMLPPSESAPAVRPVESVPTPGSMDSGPTLQPIEDFLHRPIETAPLFVPESTVDDYPSDFDEESGELPPVEHFLDPLPRVGEFAPEESNPFDEIPAATPEDFAGAPTSGSLAAEWANTDWQQYDWRSLAALGEGGESAASNDWATTDWDATTPRPERPAKDRPTAAQAIANALDQIAQKIRSGEIAAGGETDPATLAATLAAILGTRT